MGASIRESQIRLLTPDQKEIAECIGFEAYSKLAAYYAGSRVYVAKLASLELAERDSRIIRDYKAGKTSTAELAARYGVSPRRIREIIKGTLGKITKAEIIEQCPDISQITVQRTLADLQKSGEILKLSGGRYAAYIWNREKV